MKLIINNQYDYERRYKMMPLTVAGVGVASTIKKIGGKEETRKFLENLGFVVGGT